MYTCLRVIRTRARGESGVSLVELLVSVVIGLIVFTAVLKVLIIGLHKQGAVSDRRAQLETVRVAETRLVRELRQATAVTLTGTASLSYTIPTTGGTATVAFACTSGTCTRTQAGVARTAVTGLANTDVFTLTPSAAPTYVTVKLTLAAAGRTAVTLTDGADLLNVTKGT